MLRGRIGDRVMLEITIHAALRGVASRERNQPVGGPDDLMGAWEGGLGLAVSADG
jgi:hypothetical protein